MSKQTLCNSEKSCNFAGKKGFEISWSENFVKSKSCGIIHEIWFDSMPAERHGLNEIQMQNQDPKPKLSQFQ